MKINIFSSKNAKITAIKKENLKEGGSSSKYQFSVSEQFILLNCQAPTQLPSPYPLQVNLSQTHVTLRVYTNVQRLYNNLLKSPIVDSMSGHQQSVASEESFKLCSQMALLLNKRHTSG